MASSNAAREPRAWSTAIFIQLSAALLFLVGCNSQVQTEEVEFRAPVSVHEVERGTVENLIVTTGTLRASQSAVLRVETEGFMALGRNSSGARLGEGDRVQAGQVVAVVTGRDVALESGLAASGQRYESNQKVLESRRKLHEEGLISAEDLSQAETNLAEARLEWERSQLREDRTQLTAPISGVILSLVRDQNGLPVADGQKVERGFSIAQIAPIDRLIADIDLVGPDLAQVRPGLEARLRHYAWESDRFEGQVIRLSPTIDPVTRTLKAEVEIRNVDGRLRPGMFVEVTLVSERREDVLVVPRDAVIERNGARVVFVLEGQRVSQRTVRVGLGNDEVVEIREGLEGNERVVIRGLETLSDNTRVRVSKG